MQITNFAAAFSLVSVALASALDPTVLTPGVAIHANGAPIAQSLSVTAEPVTSAKRNVEKRAIGHLFVCTDANFQGQCVNLEFNTGTCYNLNSPYQDSISSLGPDSYSCTIWVDNNCSGSSKSGIIAPGIFNLNDYGLNDKISSFRCT